MAGGTGGGESPTVIKKYANRRLYDTGTSSHVTLDRLARMVKDGVDFVVRDARSGEDITRSVLTQIIVEQEAKGSHLLPVGFLRQLIGFYGDGLEALLPRYLELAMQTFAGNRERMRDRTGEAFGDRFPFDRIEELSRRNLELFERTMRWFVPDDDPPPPAPAPAPDADGALDELKAQMAAMQRQIDALAGKRSGNG